MYLRKIFEKVVKLDRFTGGGTQILVVRMGLSEGGGGQGGIEPAHKSNIPMQCSAMQTVGLR